MIWYKDDVKVVLCGTSGSKGMPDNVIRALYLRFMKQPHKQN